MQTDRKTILGIILLLTLLVMVRVFQHKLFYDPLIHFFQGHKKELPLYNALQLFAGLSFRYWLNSIFSIGIIYLFFKDAAIIKIAVLLYVILFIILISAMFIVLNSDDANLLLLFYIRRFLIQPIFLILFVPAFYYQKKMR